MDYTDIKTARDLIKAFEGYASVPYLDTDGSPTVGWGHKLTRGENFAYEYLDEDERLSFNQLTFQEDYNKAVTICLDLFATWDSIPWHKQAVLISMAFQMGRKGLRSFHQMRYYIENGMYETAADEMLDSKWAMQTGERAWHHSRVMRGLEMDGFIPKQIDHPCPKLHDLD